MVTSALLALGIVPTAAHAIDIGVGYTYVASLPYNYDFGRELTAFTIEEDTGFATFLSSKFSITTHFTSRGDLTIPARSDRVTLFAGIKATPDFFPQGMRTTVGSVSAVVDTPFSGPTVVTQTNYQTNNKLEISYSQDSLASSNRIVIAEEPIGLVEPQYGYGNRQYVDAADIRGGAQGHVVLRATYTTTYQVDTAFDRFLGWLDNVSAFDTTSAIKKVVLDYLRDKSQHTSSGELRKFRPSVSIGIRGDVIFEGIAVHTASPGVLTYAATLPDARTIDIPLAFTRNHADAVLDIAFDGQLLGTFRGSDYVTDEMNLLNLDISSFAGRSGLLSFTINADGPDSAEIFVAERLGHVNIQATSLPAVPEPGTYAMLLAGLAGMGCVVRRRRASANGR